MDRCVNCGHALDPGDHFCSECGTRVVDNVEHTSAITSIIRVLGTGTSGAIQPVGPAARSDLPTGSAMLLVHRGPGEGTEFPLSADSAVVTVGRAPQSDVFLDDVTVSRRHAEFRHGAEGWSIRDVGSLNGTYVNRQRVDDRRLSGGDEVQVGKFRFIFLVGVEDA